MSAAPAPQAWEWRATGTTWRIHHAGVPRDRARKAAARVEQAEAVLSRFRPGSDVARLSAAAGAWVDVAPLTARVLLLAERLRAETGGAFDVLVGASMRAAGYADAPGVAMACPPTPSTVLGRPPIDVDPACGRARLPRGMRLDLGGIGKGAIAGGVAADLARAADGPVLLDAGGDLVAVRGTHLVAVEHVGVRLRLRAGHAVATSSAHRRRWHRPDGTAAHHLIDPATGVPARRPAQATVVARDPAVADALATACAIRPSLARERTEPILIVDPDGAVRPNRAWREVAA